MFSRLQCAQAHTNRRTQVLISLAALFVLLVGAEGLGVHSLLAQRKQATLRTAATDALQRVGPHQYALLLGDSVPYGYQPTGDWTHGYADVWTAEMQRRHPKLIQINMGCYFETTATMLAQESQAAPRAMRPIRDSLPPPWRSSRRTPALCRQS